MFFLIAKKVRNSRDLACVIIIIVFCFYLLLRSLGTQLFHPYSYEEISSPQKSESIIIEYRYNLFDRSISYYRIYQKKLEIFMKELTKKEIIITDQHHVSWSQKEVFNFESPEWINEKRVIFDTLEGRYKFNLH